MSPAMAIALMLAQQGPPITNITTVKPVSIDNTGPCIPGMSYDREANECYLTITFLDDIPQVHCGQEHDGTGRQSVRCAYAPKPQSAPIPQP